MLFSMTSSSSSKKNSICILYCVFDLEVLPVCLLYIGKTFIDLFLSSLAGVLCFYAYYCRARHCDFNEPKNIEIGVRIQKILKFSYRVFWVFPGAVVPLNSRGSTAGGAETASAEVPGLYLLSTGSHAVYQTVPGRYPTR